MNKNIKIGSILSYLQVILQIVIGLIYTPLMIKLLGQSEYGLYNTVGATIATLNVLSLGFNSSYIRFFSKYKKNNDEENIYKLNGLFMIIFTIIGIVSFIIGIYFYKHLNLIFADGLTNGEYEIAEKLTLLFTINLSLSFPMSVFTAIIFAHERFIFIKLCALLTMLISPAVTLPLLFCGYGSVSVILVTVLISILNYFINIYYVFAKIKTRFIFHNFEKGVLKNLFIFTSFISIEIIVDQINWNIDKILLGRFKGTSAVAIYSLGFSLYSYYQMFSTSISSFFTPKIHNIILETENNLKLQKEKLTNLFSNVGHIQYIILMLLCTGLIFFGRQFIIDIWADSSYVDSYIITLLLVIPATVPLIQNVGIEIQRAQNKHKFRSVVYALIAILNLVLSIFLCKKMGAIGSAIGTSISLIIGNGIIMNIYYHKKCNIDIGRFWIEILKSSKGLIIPIIIGILMNQFVDLDNVFLLIICIGLYSIIYLASIYCFSLKKSEKDSVKSILMKMKVGVKHHGQNM